MSFANDCLDIIGECPNRIRVVQAGQCTESDEILELVDQRTGQPINLTQYGIPPGSSSSSSSMSSSSAAPFALPHTWCCLLATYPDGRPKTGVEIVYKAMPSDIVKYSFWAEVTSVEEAEKGIIHLPINKDNSRRAGVWCAMALIWENGVVKRLVPFYYEIQPNLASYNPSGPITMAEVRLSVRDVCPEANFLIDAVDFKDVEIAWAIRRPIDMWNELPPPVAIFSPINFPYRYHWLNAVVGELLQLVGTWLRRNDLDYSAGGVTVMDTKKWDFYMQRGDALKKEFKDFVKQKKIEINIQGGYSSIGGYWCTPYR